MPESFRINIDTVGEFWLLQRRSLFHGKMVTNPSFLKGFSERRGPQWELFWALLTSGQITMRKVDGWQTLQIPPAEPCLDLAAGTCNGSAGDARHRKFPPASRHDHDFEMQFGDSYRPEPHAFGMVNAVCLKNGRSETTVPIGPWLLKPYSRTELARKLKALFTPPCIEDDA